MPLPEITRLVCRDSEQPGLKLAVAPKSINILDYRQEGFLANFFDVFPGPIRSKLKNKSPGRRVMGPENLVPRVGLAPSAARHQIRFRVGTHGPQFNAKRKVLPVLAGLGRIRRCQLKAREPPVGRILEKQCLFGGSRRESD
jgi:hypothetical protein